MALPILPIAGIALKYGSVALATYAATRAMPYLRRDQAIEDSLDTVDEGIGFRRDAEQINATGRFCRVITLGKSGPQFEIDATALTRIRLRKV